MDVRTCRGCKRIFNYLTGPILCPACREALEEKFQEVKKYIREHKGTTILEVSEACEVDANQVRQWLREDRLELTDESGIMLTCESCGKPIRSGRYCEKCLNSVKSGLNQILKDNAPKEKPLPQRQSKNDPKMRFL